MERKRKLAGMALAAALVVGGLTTGSAAASAATTCGGTGSVTTTNGTLSDGATYRIQCPSGAWNGTLFLYSHGYVVPGSANPAAATSGRASVRRPPALRWLYQQPCPVKPRPVRQNFK